MSHLIVGLGNPGIRYVNTRHNAGALGIDFLAKTQGVVLKQARHAQVGTFAHAGGKVHVIKPDTYMNLSGKALVYWQGQWQVPTDHTLVIVDDTALPLGKLRLREKGSSGGHKGLEDISHRLQTQNYARLRLGIGQDYEKGRSADYVLSDFTSQEQAVFTKHVLPSCEEMVLSFCRHGAAHTMNRYNG